MTIRNSELNNDFHIPKNISWDSFLKRLIFPKQIFPNKSPDFSEENYAFNIQNFLNQTHTANFQIQHNNKTYILFNEVAVLFQNKIYDINDIINFPYDINDDFNFNDATPVAIIHGNKIIVNNDPKRLPLVFDPAYLILEENDAFINQPNNPQVIHVSFQSLPTDFLNNLGNQNQQYTNIYQFPPVNNNDPHTFLIVNNREFSLLYQDSLIPLNLALINNLPKLINEYYPAIHQGDWS